MLSVGRKWGQLTIMIAFQGTTAQHLLSDMDPNTGWNALYVKKEAGGSVALNLATGASGAVGKAVDITNYMAGLFS